MVGAQYLHGLVEDVVEMDGRALEEAGEVGDEDGVRAEG